MSQTCKVTISLYHRLRGVIIAYILISIWMYVSVILLLKVMCSNYAFKSHQYLAFYVASEQVTNYCMEPLAFTKVLRASLLVSQEMIMISSRQLCT